MLVGARGTDDLAPLDPARTQVAQGHFPDHAALRARGFSAMPRVEGQFAHVIVVLPRSKAAARHNILTYSKRVLPGGSFWIDGQKTEGVDSVLKDIRRFGLITDVHSKAHGKIFRVDHAVLQQLPQDWIAKPVEIIPGFTTQPGVFSADAVDPGSMLLARHLPDKLPARLVDFGAGWGWLAAQALMKTGVETVHLVESDFDSLELARLNVRDPRAQFHWADARAFRLPEPVNGLIMNPPFHIGRKADPALGAAFVAAAAQLLTTAGRLWMVANRHLPYEAQLRHHFAHVEETGGDSRYKIFEASGALRNPKPGKGPR